MTAWMTLSSIELVGASVPTQGSPPKYLAVPVPGLQVGLGVDRAAA
jgi:hypothetical protein